jgi:hypothetical protein
MKYIVAILLGLPFTALSQDCKFQPSKDPYTREEKLSSGFIDIGAGKVSVVATKTEFDFLFSLGKGSCFDDDCTVAISYTGTKSKSTIRNSGPTNCDGIFHLTFKNQATVPTHLQNLGNKLITSIKFTDNTKKEIEINLTEEQQNALKQLASCAVSEAKTKWPQ